MKINTSNYKSEWSDDLEGFVITFNNGKVAHTQVNIEHNRLHADFGEKYLAKYSEYDDDLSDDQINALNDFIKQTNKEGIRS